VRVKPDDAVERWLSWGHNRSEWERLALALNLAEGFQFFVVQAEDVGAEELVESLIRELATEQGVHLGGFELDTALDEGPVVGRMLDVLHNTPRPRWFWFRGGPGAANQRELNELFLYMNQKREAFSQAAEGPVVLALHPVDWRVFQQSAPDFWSIRQAVFRFLPQGPTPPPPGALAPTSFGEHPAQGQVSPDMPRELTTDPPRPTGWRMASDDVAASPSLGFVGRFRELAWLESMLHEPGQRLRIVGGGGTGKSALVRQVLPHVAADYPDGIWWIRVAEVDGDAEERERHVLGQLLRDLGQSPPGPSGETPVLVALRRAFEVASRHHRALFIFDEVEPAAWMDDIRVRAPATLVWTTRDPTPGISPEEVLPLGALGSQSSAKLLSKRAPDLEPDLARAISEAAGGQPMVLNLLGSALDVDPDRAHDVLAALLAARAGDSRVSLGAGDMADVVDTALRRLSAEARAVWPLLGLFCGPLRTDELAALSGESHDDTAARLTEFARAGLVDEAVDEDHHRIHPFLRAMAAERLSEREDADAIRLLRARQILTDRERGVEDIDAKAASAWLLRLTGEGGDLDPEVESLVILAAPRWLGALDEDSSAVSTIRQVLTRVGGVEGLAERCAELGVSSYRTDPEAAARHFLRGAELLAADGQPERAATLRLMEASLRAEQGDATHALSSIEGILADCRARKDEPNQAFALWKRGVARGALGQIDGALDDLGQASSAYVKARWPEGQARVLIDRARLLRHDERRSEASTTLQEAAGVLGKAETTPAVVDLLLHTGRALATDDDPSPARGVLEQARSGARQLGLSELTATTLAELGQVDQRLGDLRSAAFRWRQAFGLREELGDVQGQADALGSLAAVAVGRGDFEAGAKHGASAAAQYAALGDPRGEGRALQFQGLAQLLAGEADEAVPTLNLSRDRFTTANAPAAAALVAGMVGQAELARSNAAASVEAYASAITALDLVENEQAARLVDGLREAVRAVPAGRLDAVLSALEPEAAARVRTLGLSSAEID